MVSQVGAQGLNSQVSEALGYNTWQLKNGKYNGCTFCNFAPLPLLQNQGLYNDGVDVVANINDYTGINLLGSVVGADPNAQGNLYDTVLGLLSIQEEYFPQTVVKPLPFAGKANTERMGGGGYEFTFTLLYIGQDYQKAVNNLESVIKNPPQGTGIYLSLEHPTRGKITGVTNVTRFTVTQNVGIYNGCTIQFGVRVEESNIAGLAKKSITQNIFNSINTTLNVVSDINASVAVLQATITDTDNLFGGGSSVQGSSRPDVTRVNDIRVSCDVLIAKLTNLINYVYKKSYNRVSITALDNVEVTLDYIPGALNTGANILDLRNYNATQGDIIMRYYNAQVQDTLGVIDAGNFGGVTNNLKNEVRQTLAGLYDICNLCAQVNTTYSFTVPTNMSLYEVLYKNGISFDYAQEVLMANPQIKSANFVKQGTIVAL